MRNPYYEILGGLGRRHPKLLWLAVLGLLILVALVLLFYGRPPMVLYQDF